MAQIDAVVALRALNRPVVDCEGHGIALAERHDLSSALHARALFGQDELAAGEVAAWLREQDRHLDREREIAVEILVQAVEVAGTYCSSSGVGRVCPASRQRSRKSRGASG